MPQPQRPGSVTGAAIVLFAFAPFCLCCNGCTMTEAVQSNRQVMHNNVTFDTNAEIEKNAPGFRIVLGLKSGLSILLAFAGVAAGVGLLQVQNWGRYLAFVWAGCFVLLGIIASIYNFAVLMPAKMKYYDTMAKTQIAVNSFRWALWIWPFGTVLLSLIPLIIPLLLFGETVNRAFSGLPPEEGEDRDEGRPPPRRRRDEDEDEDDRPRSRRRDPDEDEDRPPPRRRPVEREEDEDDDRPRRRSRD
jgi:hypothetical protein